MGRRSGGSRRRRSMTRTTHLAPVAAERAGARKGGRDHKTGRRQKLAVVQESTGTVTASLLTDAGAPRHDDRTGIVGGADHLQKENVLQ